MKKYLVIILLCIMSVTMADTLYINKPSKSLFDGKIEISDLEDYYYYNTDIEYQRYIFYGGTLNYGQWKKNGKPLGPKDPNNITTPLKDAMLFISILLSIYGIKTYYSNKQICGK